MSTDRFQPDRFGSRSDSIMTDCHFLDPQLSVGDILLGWFDYGLNGLGGFGGSKKNY